MIPILATIFGVILAVYLVVSANPLGYFTIVKSEVNFFLLVALFFAVQILVIYVFVKVTIYVKQGVRFYKHNILKFTEKVERWIAR